MGDAGHIAEFPVDAVGPREEDFEIPTQFDVSSRDNHIVLEFQRCNSTVAPVTCVCVSCPGVAFERIRSSDEGFRCSNIVDQRGCRICPQLGVAAPQRT